MLSSQWCSSLTRFHCLLLYPSKTSDVSADSRYLQCKRPKLNKVVLDKCTAICASVVQNVILPIAFRPLAVSLIASMRLKQAPAISLMLLPGSN